MKWLYILFALFFIFGCSGKKAENIQKRSHPSHKYTYVEKDTGLLKYIETCYLPVYSDIYYLDGTMRFSLAITLSIRNTSLTDSAFILSATYHDSYGSLLKEYVNKTILLSPLESIEFVVEETENIGGAGANFIVKWGAEKYSDQIFIQAIMIGTAGQQGLSFTTNAKVIDSVNRNFSEE